MCEVNFTVTDTLRTDLLSMPHSSVFPTILVPDVKRALHNHIYAKPVAEPDDVIARENASVQYPA